MASSKKNPDAKRIGGPGSSHQNRKEPQKSKPGGLHPIETQSTKFSGVSGGGGEPDRHHGHDPHGKAGR
jgi:hypothetical protein